MRELMIGLIEHKEARKVTISAEIGQKKVTLTVQDIHPRCREDLRMS